jgi:hypothetical protein
LENLRNTQGTDEHSVTVGLPEVVYFMYSAGKIKIGYSKDVRKRLTDLSNMASSPVELIAVLPGDRELEKYLHRTFKPDRVHGEWFKPSSEIKRFLECIDSACMATMELETWLAVGSCVSRLEKAETAHV